MEMAVWKEHKLAYMVSIKAFQYVRNSFHADFYFYHCSVDIYIYIYILERLLLISASILHIQKSKLNTPAVYWL